MNLEGMKAIELAEAEGLTLNSYATELEPDGRDDLTPDEARKIALEDPRLVYLDISDPTYTYETTGEVIDGHAVVSVDAKFGSRSAGALFLVAANGDVECDVYSDCCEENPFDPEGCWPEPPADVLAEARELAAAE